MPKSPFFHPSTPRRNSRSVVHVVRVLHTPGGSQHKVAHSLGVSGNTDTNETKSTVLACAGNLTNAIVGSGIVGIPFAINQSGWLAGIFLIVICAVLTEKSLRLLVATAKHAHTASYETVAEAAFGVRGFRFIAINMWIMAYGAMLSYMMIVKDVFPTLVGVTDVYRQRALLWVISSAVMLPLSSQRDMANLSFTSRLSVVLDLILVVLIGYNAVPLWGEATASTSKEWVMDTTTNKWRVALDSLLDDEWVKPHTLFVGLGVLSFAFVCQHSAFLIAGSLNKPTVRRWSMVTSTSLVFCGILALSCGLIGYLAYGEHTQGNILRNLPVNTSSNCARAMLGTTMLFVFPMESFVARHVCVALLFAGRRAHEGNDDSDLLKRWDRRVGLTLTLFLLALIPATIFEDLGPVLALTGAVGGSSLCYLGPGGVYLGIHGERFLELMDSSWLFGMWHRQYWTTLQQRRSSANGRAALLAGTAHETTPLVAGNLTRREDEQPPPPSEQHAGGDDNLDTHTLYWTVILYFQRILAYSLGLPIWCTLCGAGKRGLTAHMHDLALKSPHPLRIGDVEYKRMTLEYEDDEHIPSGTLFYNASTSDSNSVPGTPNQYATGSLPGTPNMSAHLSRSLRMGDKVDSSVSIDQQIGKQLLEQQKQQQEQAKHKKKKSLLHGKAGDFVEPDPQEASPGWLDFIIAIAYCLLGVVALVAGLLSLAVSEASK